MHKLDNYVFHLLYMWNFVRRLIAEEKVDGMFAGNVRSSDPGGQSHSFTGFNCRAITKRQMVDITTVWSSDKCALRYS